MAASGGAWRGSSGLSDGVAKLLAWATWIWSGGRLAAWPEHLPPPPPQSGGAATVWRPLRRHREASHEGGVDLERGPEHLTPPPPPSEWQRGEGLAASLTDSRVLSSIGVAQHNLPGCLPVPPPPALRPFAVKLLPFLGWSFFSRSGPWGAPRRGRKLSAARTSSGRLLFEALCGLRLPFAVEPSPFWLVSCFSPWGARRWGWRWVGVMAALRTVGGCGVVDRGPWRRGSVPGVPHVAGG